MKRFEDKVVAITGGGSGMGKLSCELFAAEGATVCVVDINPETAAATADGILSAGGRARAWTVDITNEQAMERFFQEVVDAFGRIDVFFTVAGISPVGTATTTTYEDYRKVVALDMDSVFLGCKYAIPHMEKNGGGVILNLVGTYGIRPPTSWATRPQRPVPWPSPAPWQLILPAATSAATPFARDLSTRP